MFDVFWRPTSQTLMDFSAGQRAVIDNERGISKGKYDLAKTAAVEVRLQLHH